MFLDMTIHDFDMARFLSGSEVSEVHAYGTVLVDPEIGKAGDIDTASFH
jgi:myo-inositol 2-dehydrogenase/D-chiro-inositol 1-dehydrogenase